MNIPTVYLYDLRDETHCLYLGGFTTSDGLAIVPADSRVRIKKIYGGTVGGIPDHLASVLSVGTVRRFLEQAYDLVDFECTIDGETVLSSHDDCECHFQFGARELCRDALRSAVPAQLADTLWDALLANPGTYVVIGSGKDVTVYATFDEYLEMRARE